MKVERWVSFDATRGLTESIGGMGGMPRGDEVDRAAYLALYDEGAHPYIEAVWAELDAHGAFGGFKHQESHCPVFDDGTCGSWSMRAWGDLVAAWWNSRHPEHRVDYCSFAWEHDVDEAALLACLTPEVLARSRAIRDAMRPPPPTPDVVSAMKEIGQLLRGLFAAAARVANTTRRKRDRLRRRFNRARRQR